MEILRPDERRFADGERAVMHYTEEVPVLQGDPTLNRVLYFRRRRPELSRTEFQECWLAGMRAILSKGTRPAGVVGYAQNHTLPHAEHPDGDEISRYDVIDEFFLAYHGGLALLGSHAEVREGIRRLENNLLDTTRTRAFVGETVLNIP
jgi:hypothetical protein